MPISPDFTSVYSHTFDVDYFDCDTTGHLKLVNLCAMIQMVASQHSVLGGISFWDLQATDQAWVVNKFKVEIEQYPKWQDQITITTWIELLDGVRSIRNFEVFLNDTKIATSSSLWVIMNTVRRRPEPMKLPHEQFEKFPDRIALKHPFTTFKNNTSFELLRTDTVKYSDLDMVNHVTNIKYLEWVIDAIHQKGQLINTIKSVDMVFKKEIVFPSTYYIGQCDDNVLQHYEIRNEEGQINFQCLIE
ncbi:MAG: acyl-ACP thioesterase [Flavobacteriaceae bacterium]|jgi:acyl-ACP thioesterase|nr:acyl-ACP thioesterase [Flavobacteriaceae bacterium]